MKDPSSINQQMKEKMNRRLEEGIKRDIVKFDKERWEGHPDPVGEINDRIDPVDQISLDKEILEAA